MSLRREFSHVFEGKIWNILPVPGRNHAIVEVRDDEKFLTTFISLELNENRLRWKGTELEEKWWISLVSVNNKIALLQTYVGGANPEHKNVIGIDTESGQIRWTVERFSFYGWGTDGSLLGYQSGTDLSKMVVDPENGAFRLADWNVEVAEMKLGPSLPVSYPESSAHFPSVASFIARHEQQDIKHGVEYLEFGEFIGLSYYIEENGFLANYLLVTSNDGKLELKEKLGENLPGLGVHTFFALPDCLIFVKNKRELVSYRYD